MNSLDIEFMETFRFQTTPITAKLDLEKVHLNKNGRWQKGEKDPWRDEKRRVVGGNSSLKTNVYCK